MKRMFNKTDKDTIKDWMIDDGLYPYKAPKDFIKYLNSIQVPNLDCSVLGEYEFWRDSGHPITVQNKINL